MEAKDINVENFEKGDEVTLQFWNKDGERVVEQKTVRMALPSENALVFHFDRSMAKFDDGKGGEHYVEARFGTVRGYDPIVA